MSDDLPRPPVRFHTKQYTGRNAKLKSDYMSRLEATRIVEEYLNSIMTDVPQVKTVFDIAQSTSLGEETVREVLLENGYGYNGITF